jgi:hypothetical protein
MRKRLHESEYFRLSVDNRKSANRRGKGHRVYIITWHNWRFPEEDEEYMRDIVDPNRNISGKHGSSWTFKDRTTAEQKYTMLLMRWSS